MNAESALTCPQCATPRDIYRYCMNCGFDFSSHASIDASPDSPLETADPPATEVAATLEAVTPVVGGSSASVVLVMIVVAVAVLLLILAGLFIPFGSSDETPGDATSTGDAPSPSRGPVEPAQATCWDATRAASAAACPEVRGDAGLAFVFPSLDPDECTDQRKGAGRPAKWMCKVSLDDGGAVRIRYREHRSVAKARAAYAETYGARNRDSVLSERDDVERYVWRASEADEEGRWSLSSMYAEHPWSVTVKGDSADDVEAALADLVRFRNPRRLTP
jgi:hypothetical protein